MNAPALVLRDWVALRAATHPAHTAIEAPDGARLSYADLEDHVSRAAGWLRALGVAPGDRVALLAAASVEFAVLAHAIPRSGATLLPLNARLTEDELRFQLTDAEARVVLADGAHRALAEAASARTPARIESIEERPWTAAQAVRAATELDGAGVHSVIYTSGTTGSPKGALLTHGNFYWSAAASAENLGVEPEDRWLACMPLFHVGGLSILLRSAIYGTTAVIHAGFEERRVNAALRSEGVTLLSVVATMLRRMLDIDDDAFPSNVRAVLVGGGPVPEDLLVRARDRGLPVLQTYGLTEAASQVATLSDADALRKLGSAGQPLPITTLAITVDGRAADALEVGEILVAGPTVTPGYLNRSDATAEVLRDGWLHTGDLGYLDDEGYLFVSDRRDDLIVTGGENVYPAEVEAALTTHPGVLEAAVVGIPDARWGALVTALVVPRPNAAPSADDLVAHLRVVLAGYKLPRRFEFSEEPLPRTASGKLQRHLVRADLRDRLAAP
ncbi:MAG: o-succinylbenzoate--CoA ligase [Chloroflexi bacterium]|nr:o-succinylbenzoate--CoA ligase [Chloroflexota bacterium]MDA1145153.1 o-succinylbenzoate--CoA ligase [Chloroflexota bacterium]